MDKIIYQWEIPETHPNFTGHDDLLTEYKVEENDKAAGGIIIYAKYHNEWVCNPWNKRTLIRQLLSELKR